MEQTDVTRSNRLVPIIVECLTLNAAQLAELAAFIESIKAAHRQVGALSARSGLESQQVLDHPNL